MIDDLTDAQINSTVVEPIPSHRRLFTVHRGEVPSVVSDFLSQSSHMLKLGAESVRERVGASSNETGFRYDTDDLWPDMEPFTGVQIYTPLAEAQMSRAAFKRLMARYFRAVVTSATTHDDPITREPWWPQLVKDIAAIEERVQQGT
jgi:hypothetical protein